jgi:peptide/nickel transport system permease protein
MLVKRLFSIIVFFLGLLLISALPRIMESMMFHYSADFMNDLQEDPFIIFGTTDPATLKASGWREAVQKAFDDMIGYVKGIPSGQSFKYKHFLYFHNNEQVYEIRNFFTENISLILYSAANMMISGCLALLFGTLLGFMLARSGRWIKNLLEFLVIVPDFAAAFFLQLLVVLIYKQSGVLLTEIFTTNLDTAYLLPFLTLFYLPFVYIVRMVSSHAYKVLTEDYILTAKAKGLNKVTIYTQHVLRNVLPLIKADLYRITSIMIGNLVIIEYLFNSPGITRFLIPGLDRNLGTIRDLFYQKPNLFDQYPITVNSLLTLSAIFFLTYASMRLVLFVLERRFAND